MLGWLSDSDKKSSPGIHSLGNKPDIVLLKGIRTKIHKRVSCSHTIDGKSQKQHGYKREHLVPVNESCKNSLEEDRLY
jgi:hypothetical protein